MRVLGQPVALNGQLYVRGDSNTWEVASVPEIKNESKMNEFIMEYSPDFDQWSMSLWPPVKQFTIATMNDRLLVVGGVDNSSGRTTNIIRSYERGGEYYSRWTVDLPYPPMPSALTYPVVMSYQHYLIVACGWKTVHKMTPEVNILDTFSNRWISAEPLPSTDYYCATMIKDTVYLVGRDNQLVLRAHVPTLASGVKSGVWDTLPPVPYQRNSLFAIGNNLLTVGGSIRMFDPAYNQWRMVDDLPGRIDYPHCIVMNSQLFVLGYSSNYSVLKSPI